MIGILASTFRLLINKSCRMAPHYVRLSWPCRAEPHLDKGYATGEPIQQATIPPHPDIASAHFFGYGYRCGGSRHTRQCRGQKRDLNNNKSVPCATSKGCLSCNIYISRLEIHATCLDTFLTEGFTRYQNEKRMQKWLKQSTTCSPHGKLSTRPY
jgi:hypothetical protein